MSRSIVLKQVTQIKSNFISQLAEQYGRTSDCRSNSKEKAKASRRFVPFD